MTKTTLTTFALALTALTIGACDMPQEEAKPRCAANVHSGTLYVHEHDLESLRTITAVTGDVVVASTEWTDLRALECLESVNSSLHISDNPKLETADGLERLREVGGSIVFGSNAALVDTDSLLGIQSVGSIAIVSNPALEWIEWLRVVQDLGWLVIEDNDALVSLDSLSSLRSVGLVTIADNPRLLDVKAARLQQLVGDDLEIVRNSSLRSLELPEFVELGGRLHIRQNHSLPTCAAQQVATQLRNHGFDGEVSIYGNRDDAFCK